MASAAGGEISHAAYDDPVAGIGGLDGALRSHAEAVYRELGKGVEGPRGRSARDACSDGWYSVVRAAMISVAWSREPKLKRTGTTSLLSSPTHALLSLASHRRVALPSRWSTRNSCAPGRISPDGSAVTANSIFGAKS